MSHTYIVGSYLLLRRRCAMSIRSIKEGAKQALKGKWGIAIGVFFIYSIISSVFASIPEDYNILFLLVMFLVSGPLYIGYCWFHLDLHRGPELSVKTLFQGFSLNYVKNVISYFLLTLFTLLWTLLLIIPGIIKGLAYSMTFFILRDRPDFSALQAITESRKMMNGKKKDLFFLLLSFIPWFIIPFILLIIGITSIIVGITTDPSLMFAGFASLVIGLIAMLGISIYVTPYYMTALAVFYDDYVKPREDLTEQGPLSSNYDRTSDNYDLTKPVQ